MAKEEKAHSYRTIAAEAEGLYTEKRSKFIAHALPVTTTEEALALIEEMRKRYYDARHVCWAYRIGKHQIEERANDDGEPSSTAGKPILGQIHSQDLTDILITVTRYFGGVKLGTGGLIVAYRTAAAEALANAEITEHTLYTRYRLTFPFALINPVMMMLRDTGAETLGNDATTEGHIWDIQIANALEQDFLQAVGEMYQVSCTPLDPPTEDA